MKKSLLALAVAAFAASSAASAATVYDKDGTSLNIGGRIQSVAYSPLNDGSANNDATITNSSRFSLEGRSQIASGVAAFGFADWDLDSADSSSGNEGFTAREQYIGVDFGKFGALTVGRTYDSVKAVISATDIYEDFGVLGQVGCDDRRAGTVKYVWEGYGIYAGATYQAAKNDVVVGGAGNNDTMNVEGGYSVVLGYTTPSVVFGPISVKAAYSYLAAQDDQKYELSTDDLDNMKEFAASISWGNTSEGLYLATMYNNRKFEYLGTSQYGSDTYKGIEVAIAYYFDNGLSLASGWQYNRLYSENHLTANNEEVILRKMPVYVNYSFNSNFNVWAEAQFDMGSDRQVNLSNNFDSIEFVDSDHTVFSVGARYTFCLLYTSPSPRD